MSQMRPGETPDLTFLLPGQGGDFGLARDRDARMGRQRD